MCLLVVVDRVVGVEQHLLDGLMPQATLDRVVDREAGVDRLADELLGVARIVEAVHEVAISKARRALDVVSAEIRNVVIEVELVPAPHQLRRAAGGEQVS
jgi:hypothetical protein